MRGKTDDKDDRYTGVAVGGLGELPAPRSKA